LITFIKLKCRSWWQVNINFKINWGFRFRK